MKSKNQFDFPTKQAQTFKIYSQNQMQDTRDKTAYNKTRYKQNMQYHMQLQRNKVKQTEKQKKQQEKKQNKAKLQQQLQGKRRQLESLQQLKKQSEENQRKSYQLAILKQQEDKIKKQEDERRKKEFQQNALNRFGQAIRRLHVQKQQNSFKERLAEQRRRTTDEFQRIQRVKATKYQAFLDQKSKNLFNQQDGAEGYKKTYGSLSQKNLDYGKTCLHNLKIIKQKNKQQQNAFERGRLIRQQVIQRSQQKRKNYEQNLRRSQQRGRQALIKMQRQRQYQEFHKQSQQEQKIYNLQRIEAGKKNQFIGIKPTTLTQMQNNKKMRSQQQFNRMFFTRPLNKTESFNKSATRFQIVQSRMPPRQSQSFQKQKILQSKKKPYLRQRQQSQIPCVSEGKYSFQEPQYSEFKNQSRSQNTIHEHDAEHQAENEQDHLEENASNMKNAWKQTGIPNEKYGSSGQKQRKEVNSFVGQVQQSKGGVRKAKQIKKEENSQRQSFNTDEMMRKYGLKKDSPQKKKKQVPRGNQNKRKVVELANICQNKEQEKEELNYSSESEQDSLM